MPLTIQVTAPSVPQESRNTFKQYAELVAAAFEMARVDAQIPEVELDLLLTDTFVDDVQRLMRPFAEETLAQPFATDRVGGTTVAKNLPQSDDHSKVAIVFSSALWKGAEGTQPSARAEQLAVVAHELAHPLFDRARHAAGVMKGVKFPSRSSSEVMRSSTRTAWDEYRAEILADAVARSICSASDDGKARPLRLWDLWGEAGMTTLADVIRKAHPAWPDLVDSYRKYRLNLGDMWRQVVSSIDQTFTIVAHVQAHADAADLPDPLADESVVDLPAARLYLCAPWRDFRAVIQREPKLPSIEKLPAIEERVVAAGETMFRNIIRPLGLTVRDLPDRTLHIDVTAPIR